MNINPTLASGTYLFESGTLDCNSDSCLMDYIVPAVGSCSSSTVTSSLWQVTTACTFTQGNSTRNRYSCRLHSPSAASWQSMSPNRLPSGSAECTLQSPVPATDGTFNYSVQVRPGRHVIAAGTVVIKRPTVPSWTCSPSGIVPENATVTCTCSTVEVGQPAGTLRWVTGSNNNFNVNIPVAVSNAGNSSVTFTRRLTRSDIGTQYRCDVQWSSQYTIASTVFTARVGYAPTMVNLSVNATRKDGQLTVIENSTVTFSCLAVDGYPASVITVSGPRQPADPSGPSPHNSSLAIVQCQDAGTFVCSAGNGFGNSVSTSSVLYIACGPRSTHNDLGVVHFRNRSTVVTFLVTAYPVPSSFVFNYTGPNGTDPAAQVKDVDMSVSCFAGSSVNQFTCHLAVLDVRSWQAAGFYTLAVSNTEGHVFYKLQLLYSDSQNGNTNSQQQCSPCQQGAIIGLAVALGFVLLTAVIVLVCLGRRGWVCPGSERRLSSSADAPKSRISTVSKRKSDATRTHENDPGPYDSLRMSEVGQRSPYTEIQHGNSVRHPLNEEAAYYNTTCEQTVTSS